MSQDRQRVFSSEKFSVDLVPVQTRDGQTVSRPMVVHPGAVVVLALGEDGRVVTIRNRRFAVGRTLWELPAGTLGPDEDPALCAARELAEETGYAAGRIEPLCRFYASPGICDELMHVFLATELTPGPQQLEATEHIDLELAPLERLLRAVSEGEIEDGKTIAALLYYQSFRGPAVSRRSSHRGCLLCRRRFRRAAPAGRSPPPRCARSSYRWR